MKEQFTHKYFSDYNPIEWRCIKVSVVLIWMQLIGDISISSSGVPFPSGVFQWIDCGPLISANTVNIALIVAGIFSVLYVFEWQMKWITGAMFLLSLLMFSLQDSNGVFPRNGIYTTIFLAQNIAYWRNQGSLSTERVQFPIQIIVAGYLLAAIAKLRESGLHWIMDAPMASIQMFKSYAYYYIDTGNSSALVSGGQRAEFALSHPCFIRILFGISLFCELFACMAVKNKKWAFAAGVVLMCMHLGINFFMHILIKSIFYPMLIFLLNPLYWLVAPAIWIMQKLSLRPQKSNTTD
jgi:hypothetical protein